MPWTFWEITHFQREPCKVHKIWNRVGLPYDPRDFRLDLCRSILPVLAGALSRMLGCTGDVELNGGGSRTRGIVDCSCLSLGYLVFRIPRCFYQEVKFG